MTTLYRVAWKDRDNPDYEGHGSWMPDKSRVMAAVEMGNKKYGPNFYHWLEEQSQEPAP